MYDRKPAAPIPPKESVQTRPVSCIESPKVSNSPQKENKVIVISSKNSEYFSILVISKL